MDCHQIARRRDSVVHAVSLTASVSIVPSVVLDASGGVATAGGGDVSIRVLRPDEVAYAVGRTIRTGVDSKGDAAYVLTTATSGGFLGGVLTGGAEWGAGVGFVAGWVVGVRQLRRLR